MSGAGWNVIRCSACSTCHGHRKTGRSCPHCGQKLPSDAEIVATVATAAELRIEVALANTPEELRDMLRKRLEKNDALFQPEEQISFKGLPKLLLDAKDEHGIVTRKSIIPILEKSGNSLDVQDLIDLAESQGLLVRLNTDCWQLLE
tara:strand:- start:58 stop:498 length:441 start_codon:yes stop_codon:yes gene_type:complete